MATAKYGTFQDSLRAPVHRWFTYPAGYSHRLVEAKIAQYALGNEHLVGDPFVGTGTTSLAAKTLGVNSVGVEAHPFVYWVANTKLAFEHDSTLLEKEVLFILEQAEATYKGTRLHQPDWPDLVRKCFTLENLNRLSALRAAVLQCTADRRDFFKVALTATLRDVTSAGAGWPYIAPSKFAERKVQKDAFREFANRSALMIEDVNTMLGKGLISTQHKLVNGDARSFGAYTGKASLDLILTSPPYLNNYDYADRTRLESYFWGYYSSWAEITKNVRNKLIIAATTQVRRRAMEEISELPTVAEVSPLVHSELIKAVNRLDQLRSMKRGKKSYDLMVAGYFEDMLQVIREAYAALKPGCPFILVLGDSAPYGVHIPTDELIGRLALEVGFSDCNIEVIRTRGEKWAGNSQRHKVPLRESIVTVVK